MSAGKQNNNRRIGSYIALHVSVLLAAVSLLAIGCDSADEELTQPVQETPQQIMYTFSTQQADGGIKRWTLVADKATFLKEVVKLQKPTVQIFEEGKWAITITGDRGELIQSTNDIYVFENVIGKSRDGYLYTDELHWRDNAGKLFAPNTATIVRGDSTMIGQELEGDPTLEVVIMKDVQSKIYPKDEKFNATEK